MVMCLGQGADLHMAKLMPLPLTFSCFSKSWTKAKRAVKRVCVYVILCVCVRACVRACMRACVRACMHACMRVLVCVCVSHFSCFMFLSLCSLCQSVVV